MKSTFIIAYIVREPVGGIWKHIEILIRHFEKMGVSILLIGNLSRGDKKFQRFRKNNYKVEYIDIPISRNPSVSDLKNIYKIRRLLKEKHVDLFHGHGAKGGLYARMMKLFFKTKVLYTPHGGSVHPSFGRLQTFFYRTIESLLFFMTDKVVAESLYTKERYLRTLFFHYNMDSRLALNYNGIECHPRAGDRGKKDRPGTVLASFGMLRHEKGQDILILAAKKLIDDGYSIKLRIFGDGDARPQYRKLIEESSLEKEISLHGETDAVDTEMKKSDIIVQPSRFESFGYVLLEAMCNSVPVIASTAGGMPEILEHGLNGRLFENGDVDDLAKQIAYMIDHPEHTKKYIDEGVKTVAMKFSAKIMCDGIHEIYEELIKSGSGSQKITDKRKKQCC